MWRNHCAGAALWDEVKDRLKKSALGFPGGQQQRMCIARALAVEPDVLLMDEPTSALDPASTMRIEELMASLKESYTVVIVTHNMQQAARISDKCAFFLVGDLIEFGETEQVFSMPKDKRTEDYITAASVDARGLFCSRSHGAACKKICPAIVLFCQTTYNKGVTLMNARLSFDAELESLSASLIRMAPWRRTPSTKRSRRWRPTTARWPKALLRGPQHRRYGAQHRAPVPDAAFAPAAVAGDLRKISTAIKMITDIERIGDAAADIAEITTHIKEHGIPASLSDIADMAEAAQKMVDDSIQSYVREDLVLAADVIARDDVVDDYFNKIKKDLAAYIAVNEEHVDCAIDYLMIAKYLERLGDHAVNICEWVQFYKTGMHKSERIL